MYMVILIVMMTAITVTSSGLQAGLPVAAGMVTVCLVLALAARTSQRRLH